MNFIRSLAYPLSLIYGTAGWLRNKLFDNHILPQSSFDLPVISVGNLSSGGTGKTPLTEYLIRLLSGKHKVLCTLSRGYGRTTKGFILANGDCTPNEIGDEPCQYVHKYPHVRVAVSEKRVKGIRELLKMDAETGVILLDDAYQHRYVKPGLSIMLTNYHAMYTEDHVFPSGRLREFRIGARRADIIIVTKTPKIFSPITRRRILEDIRPFKHQTVLFSYLKYAQWYIFYLNS